MGNPRFSVIVPTYNRAHVLPRAIDSVLNQTCADFELLLVDDGSTDQTEACVRGYDDERIRYIKHEKNLGQNRALNSGIEVARGEFISFLDSDDEWLTPMLERVLEKFTSNKDFDCVYVSYGIIDLSGEVKCPFGNTFEGYIYKEALELGEISPPTALTVRKKCFDVVGTFEPDVVICQDDVMCLKLAKVFKFGRVNEVLAMMHFDAGGRISQDPVLTAHGYYYLRNMFANDIVKHCGRKIMAKHYVDSGLLFLEARERKLALKAFGKSLRRGSSATATGYIALSLLAGIRGMISRGIRSATVLFPFGRKCSDS